MINEVWLDNETGTYRSKAALESAEHGIKISTRRLQGGVSDGIDLVTIDAGELTVEVLPTRGMGLKKVSGGGLDLKWDSPMTCPVHPAFVDQQARQGIGWLEGFNELLCRCGLSWNGAPGPDEDGNLLTLHGRIANLPAIRVAAGISEQGHAWLEGTVHERSLFGPCLKLVSRLEIDPARLSLRIIDRVVNEGGGPADFELLYHINFGQPLLSAGAECVAPAKRVIPRDAAAAPAAQEWARYAGAVPGFAEEVFFLELAGDSENRTEVLLKSVDGRNAAGVAFSLVELPCFTLWKNTQAVADGYCTGLEPGTDYPNHRSFERSQQRLKVLGPGDTWSGEIRLNLYCGTNQVDAAERRIRDLAPTEPQVLSDPDPDLSP